MSQPVEVDHEARTIAVSAAATEAEAIAGHPAEIAAITTHQAEAKQSRKAAQVNQMPTLNLP